MKDTGSDRLRSFLERGYAFLLTLYPAEHRRDYGRLMMQLFRDLRREAETEKSSGKKHLWWVYVSADLLVSCLYEHFAVIRRLMMRKNTIADEVLFKWNRTILAVISACIIAGGLLARPLILSLEESAFMAVVVSVAANILAAFILERATRAGWAIFNGAILLCALQILSAVWYRDCYWVYLNPMLGGLCILSMAGVAHDEVEHLVIFSLYARASSTALPSPYNLKEHLFHYWKVYVTALLFTALQLTLPLISASCQAP